jgi:hypothetical protein
LIGSGDGRVHCRPCRRNKDAHIVTVIAGVVVNIDGTTIAVATAICVVVILTVAITIAIAAAIAQPLLLLPLLVDCCLLEVLECIDVDVVEGIAKSPPERHEQEEQRCQHRQ